MKLETVGVLADGKVHPDVIVSSDGEITLNYQVTDHIIYGFKYTSKMITKSLEAGLNFSTSKGAIRRLDRVLAHFYKSYGGKYSGQDPYDEATYKELEFYRPTELMGGALVPQTRLINTYVLNDPDREAKIGIMITLPLPMTILFLVIRGQTNE